MISEHVPFTTIVTILAFKLFIGMIAGFVIDICIRLIKNRKEKESKEENDKVEEEIGHICEKEHCHCDHGIVKSALKHTINIFIFILIITLLINIAIYFVGEERIASFIEINPVLGPVLAGIIGLIPNCASSVILTKLYLENIVTATTMISGLLVNAGVGLAVLFKMNKGIKKNILIVILLYAIGVISGLILQLVRINF